MSGVSVRESMMVPTACEDKPGDGVGSRMKEDVWRADMARGRPDAPCRGAIGRLNGVKFKLPVSRSEASRALCRRSKATCANVSPTLGSCCAPSGDSVELVRGRLAD